MNLDNVSTIDLEIRNSVGLITLSSPENNNALSKLMFSELTMVLDHLESNNAVRAIVITGNKKVFAAGADITEIKDKNYIDVYNEEFVLIQQSNMRHAIMSYG